MIKVTITECYGGRQLFVSTHKTNDEAEAQQKAIVKAYGRGKFLCVDHGITTPGSSTQYGQIGHYVDRRQGLISTDTGLVRIDCENEA